MLKTLFRIGTMILAILILTACHGQSDQNMPLKPKQETSIFMIYSKASQPIMLNRVETADQQGTAHAGWASRLLPQHYSAILIGQKDFTLSCKPLACSDAISIQEQPVSLAKGNSYWIVENETCDKLVKLAAKRGYKIQQTCSKP